MGGTQVPRITAPAARAAESLCFSIAAGTLAGAAGLRPIPRSAAWASMWMLAGQ
jgi:hypothetical protein